VVMRSRGYDARLDVSRPVWEISRLQLVRSKLRSRYCMGVFTGPDGLIIVSIVASNLVTLRFGKIGEQ
jgi:hypothetical protein